MRLHSHRRPALSGAVKWPWVIRIGGQTHYLAFYNGGLLIMQGFDSEMTSATAPVPAMLTMPDKLQLSAGDGHRVVIMGDIRLLPGDRVLISGPSGCGKTTLLMTMGLLKPPRAGHINISLPEFGTLDWTVQPNFVNRRRACRFRRAFGMVFQDARLLKYLTIGENLAISRVLSNRPDLEPGFAKTDQADRLKRLGLFEHKAESDVLRRLPETLSLGEQRRVALARALGHSPEIVLIDEPSTSVDAKAWERILAELTCWAEQNPASILVIASHQQDFPAAMVTRRLTFQKVERQWQISP